MYKKQQVVMLTTNQKPTIGEFAICLNSAEGIKPYLSCGIIQREEGFNIKSENQHLYILSDDKIKEGDWCIMLDSVGNVFSNPQQYNDPKTQHLNKGLMKIIATTDSSLTKKENYIKCSISGSEAWDDILLPQIPQLFIQHYVDQYNSGKAIDYVEVEYEQTHWKNTKASYEDKFKLKINNDNTINIKSIKDSWSREEVIALVRPLVETIEMEFGSVTDAALKEALDEWIQENL